MTDPSSSSTSPCLLQQIPSSWRVQCPRKSGRVFPLNWNMFLVLHNLSRTWKQNKPHVIQNNKSMNWDNWQREVNNYFLKLVHVSSQKWSSFKIWVNLFRVTLKECRNSWTNGYSCNTAVKFMIWNLNHLLLRLWKIYIPQSQIPLLQVLFPALKKNTSANSPIHLKLKRFFRLQRIVKGHISLCTSNPVD